jgi:hypothetical protein
VKDTESKKAAENFVSMKSDSTSKKKRIPMQEVVQSDPLRFFRGAITSSRLLSATKEVNPLIPGMFRGSTATVFAYGATGSEKTYTMLGTNLLPRLMPLALSTILSKCQGTGRKTSKLMTGCCVILIQKSKTMSDPIKVDDSTIVVGCRKGRSNLSVMVATDDCQELLERFSVRMETKRKKKKKNLFSLRKKFNVDESILLRSRPWGQGSS